MLDKLITPKTLTNLAGAAAFAKGQTYFSSGAVSRLRIADGTVTASVDGTEAYRVELRARKSKLAADCTCPRAADGYFCKHCVAVGLAWIASHASENTTVASTGKARGRAAKAARRGPWRDIQTYLEAQTPAALIVLLQDVLQRDDALYRSLLIKSEATHGGDADQTLRRVIDTAVSIDGYIDWREVSSYAGDLHDVVDSLAPLLKSGAGRLVLLAEYAIERIEGSLEDIDDSNGEVSSVVERLSELHAQACNKARPDPLALAARLFRLQTTLPFGLCRLDAYTYRKVLGTTGLRRYRELAEAEWNSFKPLDRHAPYDSRRAAITRIMEDVVKASGNIDELVAIKSKDLSSGYNYLDIAELLAKARRSDEALQWAERGLSAFPDQPDQRLRDFLVAAYLKRKRNDEAVALTWAQFEESPDLESYKKLHGITLILGVWPAQRTRALAKIAEEDGTTADRKRISMWGGTHSPRLAIALWENDLDAAWVASRRGAHSTGLLVTLAGKLESMRADDAITLYREVVPVIVAQTGNEAYAEAVKLVRRTGALMKTQLKLPQFGDYLAELRVEFKPKRNFIKLLDGVGGHAA